MGCFGCWAGPALAMPLRLLPHGSRGISSLVTHSVYDLFLFVLVCQMKGLVCAVCCGASHLWRWIRPCNRCSQGLGGWGWGRNVQALHVHKLGEKSLAVT